METPRSVGHHDAGRLAPTRRRQCLRFGIGSPPKPGPSWSHTPPGRSGGSFPVVTSQYTLRASHGWRHTQHGPPPLPRDGTERDPFRVVRETEGVAPGVVRVVGRRGVWRRLH